VNSSRGMAPPRATLLLLVVVAVDLLACAVSREGDKDWNSMSDTDFERIYQEWRDNDAEDEGEEEEDPLRTPPELDLDLEGLSEETIRREAMRGRTVMVSVTMVGLPSEYDTRALGQRWQMGLMNGGIRTELFVLGKGRLIVQTAQGERTVEVKDFLVQQPEVWSVRVDGKQFPGRGAGAGDKEEL